jgi:prevent-host-death family protein
MAESIGVRDLKNRASEIIRQVREEQAEYVVTVHGTPVAVLRPLDEEEVRRQRHQSWQEFLRRAAVIAEAVGAEIGEETNAVAMVAEQRRY